MARPTNLSRGIKSVSDRVNAGIIYGLEPAELEYAKQVMLNAGTSFNAEFTRWIRTWIGVKNTADILRENVNARLGMIGDWYDSEMQIKQQEREERVLARSKQAELDEQNQVELESRIRNILITKIMPGYVGRLVRNPSTDGEKQANEVCFGEIRFTLQEQYGISQRSISDSVILSCI